MRILPVAHSNHQVQFTSAAGEAVVEWRGPQLPTLGVSIDVELEIGNSPYWSEVEVVDAEPGLYREPDAVARGRVLAVDDDGVLALSIGGAVVLLEVRDPVPDGLVGKVLEFEASRIAVCPTNV